MSRKKTSLAKVSHMLALWYANAASSTSVGVTTWYLMIQKY